MKRTLQTAVFSEILRKTTKNLTQGSRSPNQDLKPGPPNNRVEMLINIRRTKQIFKNYEWEPLRNMVAILRRGIRKKKVKTWRSRPYRTSWNKNLCFVNFLSTLKYSFSGTLFSALPLAFPCKYCLEWSERQRKQRKASGSFQAPRATNNKEIT
jgi:hypothetical protein